MNFLPSRRLIGDRTVYFCWMVSEFGPHPLRQYTLDRGCQSVAASYWSSGPELPRFADGLVFPLPRNWCLIPIPPSGDSPASTYILGLKKRAVDYGISAALRLGSPSS